LAHKKVSWLRGLDVAHYQGDVNWEAVAADGIQFCFIKATEGTTDIDPRFQQNWVAADAAGVLRGAYHFFRPELDPEQQAKHFLSVVKLDSRALPPALDIEVTDGVAPTALQSAIHTWVGTIGAATNCNPVIYADPYFWRQDVGADFSDCPLWLACYAAEPEVPPNWKSWTFWQYTDLGSVSGIEGSVDLDYCMLSLADVQNLRSR